MAKIPLNEGFSLFFLSICGIILTMNYHDFIWDLGGTLLDNYRNVHKCLCSDIEGLSHPSRSWFCLCSIKNLNTGCNSNLCTSYFQFSYGIQEKEALGLQEAGLIWGSKRVTRRDPSTWRTPFWYLIGIQPFDPYWTDRHCTLLYGDCNGRRGLSSKTRPSLYALFEGKIWYSRRSGHRRSSDRYRSWEGCRAFNLFIWFHPHLHQFIFE